MKKKGLIALALIAVYLLSFGGYALTVDSAAVKDTLKVVSLEGTTRPQDPPLSTIIPDPPPTPPLSKPK